MYDRKQLRELRELRELRVILLRNRNKINFRLF